MENKGVSTLYIRDRLVRETKMQLSDEDWWNICENWKTTTRSKIWRVLCWKNIVMQRYSKHAGENVGKKQEIITIHVGTALKHRHFWKDLRCTVGRYRDTG